MDAEQITAWGAAAAAVVTALTPLVLKVLDWVERRRAGPPAETKTGAAIPRPRRHSEQRKLARKGK